jgi:hypothetical protein
MSSYTILLIDVNQRLGNIGQQVHVEYKLNSLCSTDINVFYNAF